MRRNAFLKQVGLGTLALGAAAPALAQKPARRGPNILWVLSEDTSPDMGCYGTAAVQTPRIDRLASEGVRFTNAFTTAPVCSAARSAFMTGMYQTTIGAHQHRTADKQRLPDPVLPITEYFRRAGYFTANVRDPAPGVRGSGKRDFNFLSLVPDFDGESWQECVDRQPFFAQVNLTLTHRNFARDPERPIAPDQVQLPPYYPDHPITRRDWADYLESVQIVDRQLGAILDRLDEEGLADNTIVVYMGDHGRPHVRDKQWLYDGGIRVPLIMRWPRTLPEGEVSNAMVSAIDLAPTLMSLAGLTPPEHWQGRVVAGPEATGQAYIFAARDRCDGTWDRIRCVRSNRWKYIRNFHPELPYMQFNAYKKLQYPAMTLLPYLHGLGRLNADQTPFMADRRPEEELYDLAVDPHELRNLADDPAHKETLVDLRMRLDEWMDRTGDQGRTPEPDAVRKGEHDRMMAAWRQGMERRGLSPDISDAEYVDWWRQQLQVDLPPQ